MNHILLRGLFIAGMACVTSAQAADIRKCVAADGQVTLTDEECPGHTRLAKVLVQAADTVAPVPAAAPAPAPVAVQATFAPARMPARYVNLTKTSKPTGGLSLDTSTLRTARVNMRVLDSLRGQRMASLQ